MNQTHTPQPTSSTRERLLFTALDLFSTHGYQSTSLRDLATQLGVQPGSIYNHIENKQGLLFELMEETLDDLLDQTKLSLKRKRTQQSKLSLFVQASVSFQSNDPKKLTLIDREITNLSCAQRDRIKSLLYEYEQCLVSVINTEAAGSSLPRSKMKVLVSAIIGMLHSHTLWSQDSSNVAPEELSDHLTNIISGAIAATKR